MKRFLLIKPPEQIYLPIACLIGAGVLVFTLVFFVLDGGL